MKENFENVRFEIAGDSWEIDDWWKKADNLAMHRGLTMSERDNVSYVERIVESIKTLDKYGVRVAHDACIKSEIVFKAIHGEVLPTEYSKIEEGGVVFYCKTSRKMYHGVEFWHIDTIDKAEYEANTLEGVA